MKYCPNCKRDFEDTATFCKWCEVDLVDTLDEEGDALKEKGEELESSDGTITGEKVCIWNSFDVLTIAKIEKWLKDAGIPVEVRQSVPLNDDGEDEEEEEAVEAAEAASETEEAVEAAEEAVEEPVNEPKKGFFARLFGKKTQEEIVETEDEPVLFNEDDLFDVFVPDELKDEALRILNESFGVIGADGYGIDNGEEE